MLKNLAFFSVTLFSSVQLYAQFSASIKLGEPYRVVDAPSKNYYRKGNEILTIKVTKKEFTLQKFSCKTLAQLSFNVYDDFPKGAVIEKITRFKDLFYVFYSSWDGENEQLFSREIDFTTGQFKGQGKKVFSEVGKISGSLSRTGYFSYGVTDKFDFYFSYDSSKMVIQYSLKPKEKDDSKNFETVGVHVYDKNLSEQWSGKLTMPYTEKKMDNIDYSVDSQGNVYAVTKVFDDNTNKERNRGEDEPNYHLEILKFGASTTALSKTIVNVADKFIKTIWLYESSARGTMICAGFYNNGKKRSNVDGIVYFKLGNDGKYFDLATHDIPVSILNQYVSKSTAKKNEKKDDDDEAEFENLVLDEVRIQADGSLIMMSEQWFVKYHYSGVGNTARSTPSYHYNDILVAKIESDGKLGWMKKLPKRQEGKLGLGGMSYKYLLDQGNHRFVFLDNLKNINLPLNEKPNKHVDGQGGIITSYIINDKTGDIGKKTLADIRNVKGIEVFQFSPYRIIPGEGASFYFESYKKGKEDILIRVEIPK